ncbi:reverse transcriptase domain-containing protein [Tanacetum coccineum]
MTAIFHDMMEDFMEVFMDDFSVFCNSFDCCLANLDRILARCEETSLVLNWEKCQFMVKERIVLGHKISGAGIEVDRAKIDVIAKLPYPTNVKGGVENLVVDHLSRLENPDLRTFTEDEITDELRRTSNDIEAEINDDEPWYADYVNYIVGKIVSPKWTQEKRRRFFSQVKNYFWDEPYAFRLFLDNVMRRCVAGSEIFKILAHCHEVLCIREKNFNPTHAYYNGSRTSKDNEDPSWNTSFKTRRTQKTTSAVEALWKTILRCYLYLLGTLTSKDNEDPSWNTSFKTRRTQKTTSAVEALWKTILRCYLYLLGTFRVRSVEYNPKNWSEKLDDALWAFRTAYKTPTGCTPPSAAPKNHFMELNELMELRDGAYKNTHIYKERTKKWHDSRLRGDKNFKVGDKVLLFNSRFKMHPVKPKSKWCGPNVVKTVYPYGMVEITDKNIISFKVNGQRLKKYYDGNIEADEREDGSSKFYLTITLENKVLRTTQIPLSLRWKTVNHENSVIMEYLVKISKKARILELKRRHFKITVLTSYTPYPSRKIRRICACRVHLQTIMEQDPIVVYEQLTFGVQYLLEQIIMEYLVNISKRRAFWSLNEDILKINYSDNQYVVSIKEDTAYPCLHSLKTTKETSPICRI